MLINRRSLVQAYPPQPLPHWQPAPHPHLPLQQDIFLPRVVVATEEGEEAVSRWMLVAVCLVRRKKGKRGL
jgi:hypothetical protein